MNRRKFLTTATLAVHRTGAKLEYDGTKGKVNHPQAIAFLNRQCRESWKLNG